MLKIPLKRTGFKLKYQLSGVTDGAVRIIIYKDKRIFKDNIVSSSYNSYDSDPLFIAFENAAVSYNVRKHILKTLR